jgi:DNA-binding LacI/PurR family transcriptional regulator
MSTIQKVAKEAGVSVATVSRTFNFPEKVNGETREIVEQAAARLRYIPNASARSLRTRRSQTLGVVLPTLTNPVFAECLQGVAQAAAAASYSIMPFTTDYQLNQEESAVRALHGFGVDGLILVVSDPNSSAALDFVREQKIPYVLAYNRNDAHPCISVDNPAAFALMVRYLASLGHARIAMVSGRRRDSDRAQQRYSGFLSGMAAAGLVPHPIIEVPFIDYAVDQIILALQQDQRPTALVCSNDLLAIRAIRAAHQCGLRVPTDISVTGFDGIRLGQDLTPSLTTISQPNADIGRYSVSLLIQCLSQGSMPGPAASLLLNYVLCPAESSAPPS